MMGVRARAQGRGLKNHAGPRVMDDDLTGAEENELRQLARALEGEP